MKLIKVAKFLVINITLLYLSVLLYDNYIWVGTAFSPGDAMEATNLSIVIGIIVVLNVLDFATEIIEGSD